MMEMVVRRRRLPKKKQRVTSYAVARPLLLLVGTCGKGDGRVVIAPGWSCSLMCLGLLLFWLLVAVGR